MTKIFQCIDRLNELAAKHVAGYLSLFYIALTVFEVTMRYVFGRPTVWTSETSSYIYSAQWLLGGAYVILLDRHVRVAIFYEKFSPRGKAILDTITGFLFLTFIGILFWKAWGFAWKDTLRQAGSGSFWNPPIWPIELVFAISSLLMAVQGLVQLIRNLAFAIKGEVVFQNVIQARGETIEKADAY